MSTPTEADKEGKATDILSRQAEAYSIKPVFLNNGFSVDFAQSKYAVDCNASTVLVRAHAHETPRRECIFDGIICEGRIRSVTSLAEGLVMRSRDKLIAPSPSAAVLCRSLVPQPCATALCINPVPQPCAAALCRSSVP